MEELPAAESSSSLRDFTREKAEMLAQADAARSAADRIDTNTAVREVLFRTHEAADEALARVRLRP
jgi:hypothetical protein